MGKIRRKAIILSEKFHGTVHLLFGLFAIVTTFWLYENSIEMPSYSTLLAAAILGSYLPDIDHVFYAFGYGRKSEYASGIRMFLRKLDLKSLSSFIKSSHKHVTGIYSHNIGSLVLVLIFVYIELYKRQNVVMTTFFIAWCYHYLFDIIEDLLYFNKLNKNWYFIFNKR